MAKLEVPAGTTSKLIKVFAQNSSATNGAGLTGLANNTANLTCFYIREGAANTTSMSLVSATLGTWSSNGFIVVDANNMPGVYEIGLPNAAIASGANSVLLFLTGAANLAPLPIEIELTATSNQDAVRGGMTALPNANAGANTGLPVVGTQIPNANSGASGGLPTCDSTNSVKIQTPVKRNTALNNFSFVMLNTSGNPQTGLTVTATRDIDNAGFSPCANSVSEIANGWYVINLAAADLNGTNIALRFTAASVRDTNILLCTLP